MPVIKFSSLAKSDEKLALVCVRTRVSHAQYSYFTMSYFRMELIFKRFPKNAFPA